MTAARAPQARPKRRYPRLTLRVDVVIETPHAVVRAEATTLGAGGLFVSTPDTLAPGTPVVVRFRLPGDPGELCFPSHVAWNRAATAGGSPGLGVEFDDATMRSLLATRLEQWADRRESDPRSDAGGA